MQLPPILVTNFKRRVTGVYTTAVNVTRVQQDLSNQQIGLVGPGHRLKLGQVLRWGWRKPEGGGKRVWHVRRNSEMLWGLIARDVLGQPVRLVFTSAAVRRHSALPRWLISRMDAVVATSARAAGFVPHVAEVIPHGVDTQAFKPGEKTPYPSLMTVGRIRHEKGTHVLIEAVCRVFPSFPTARLHLIGRAQSKDQPYLAGLKEKVRAAGIEAQVIWEGELSPQAVAEQLGRAHILAATSLYEGYGLTAYEGLAAGCALLVSDAGAFARAVEGTGELVPVDDVVATAVALERMLGNPEALGVMGVRARELAVSRFSIEAEAKALLALYARLQA